MRRYLQRAELERFVRLEWSPDSGYAMHCELCEKPLASLSSAMRHLERRHELVQAQNKRFGWRR